MFKSESSSFTEGKPLLLVDTAWLLHKNFNAMKSLSCVRDGVEVSTGHLYGTLRILQMLSESYRYNVVFCLDSNPQSKRDVYVEYKADRSSYFDLKQVQKDFAVMAGAVPNTCVAVAKGIEADEVMYSLAKTYPGKVDILTGDNDLLQAVDDSISVVRKITKTSIERLDASSYIQTKFGVKQENLLLYRVLSGDVSDNIDRAVSDKKAKEWSEKFINCADLLSFVSDELLKEKIKRNYFLMKLNVVSLSCWKSPVREAIAMAASYKLNSFIKFLLITNPGMELS